MDDLRERFEQQSSEELIEIWQHHSEDYREEALDAIALVLQARDVSLPARRP